MDTELENVLPDLMYLLDAQVGAGNVDDWGIKVIQRFRNAVYGPQASSPYDCWPSGCSGCSCSGACTHENRMREDQ